MPNEPEIVAKTKAVFSQKYGVSKEIIVNKKTIDRETNGAKQLIL